MHVDGYPIDGNSHISPTRKWRWDEPGLPMRSEYTRASYWQDGTFYTEPHENGQCVEYYPPIQFLPESLISNGD